MTKLKKQERIVFHYRKGNKDVAILSDKKERGGVTVVYDPTCSRYGLALCGPEDNFKRSRGIEIATGRVNNGLRRPTRTLEAAKTTASKLARRAIAQQVKYRLAKLEEQQRKLDTERLKLQKILTANT